MPGVGFVTGRVLNPCADCRHFINCVSVCRVYFTVLERQYESIKSVGGQEGFQ